MKLLAQAIASNELPKATMAMRTRRSQLYKAYIRMLKRTRSIVNNPLPRAKKSLTSHNDLIDYDDPLSKSCISQATGKERLSRRTIRING